MVERAEGSRKWDVDGNEYVDYTMGHGALILGHAHPIPTEAAIAQLSRGTHYGASHEIETEWAEQVCAMVPSVERVRFTGSGTEATLMAMRLARAHTGRERVVKFHYHFHGWHDYAHVAQSDPLDIPMSAGIPQAVQDTVTGIPPDLDCVRAELSKGDVAALIVEPTGAGWAPCRWSRRSSRPCRKYAASTARSSFWTRSSPDSGCHRAAFRRCTTCART